MPIVYSRGWDNEHVLRRLWRAPFEKPAAVVLSLFLAVPSVLSFLFIAMIPAELSQYKDGFWLLFSWIVFFYFSYKYWRAICNVLINDYLESDEEGGEISAFMANSAQGITNAAKRWCPKMYAASNKSVVDIEKSDGICAPRGVSVGANGSCSPQCRQYAVSPPDAHHFERFSEKPPSCP